MTKVLQQAIIVMLEKIKNLNRHNKGIQLYIHRFKNLNGPLLQKKKKKNCHNSPKISFGPDDFIKELC